MNRITVSLFTALLGSAVCLSASAAEPAKATTTAKPKARNVDQPRCVFPDNKKQKAPAWVCGEAPKGQALFATASAARAKGSGVQDTKDRAVAEARLKLAKQLAAQGVEVSGPPTVGGRLAGPDIGVRLRPFGQHGFSLLPFGAGTILAGANDL